MPRYIPIFAALLVAFGLDFASYKWGMTWFNHVLADLAPSMPALSQNMYMGLLFKSILLTGIVFAILLWTEKRWPRRPSVMNPKGLLTWSPFVGVAVVALGVGMSTEAPVSIPTFFLGLLVAFFSMAWKILVVFRLFFPWALSVTSRSMAMVYACVVYACFDLTQLGAGVLPFNALHSEMVTSALVAMVYGFWTLQIHRVWPIVVFATLDTLLMMVYPLMSSMFILWANVLLIMMGLLALWALFVVVRSDAQKRT